MLDLTTMLVKPTRYADGVGTSLRYLLCGTWGDGASEWGQLVSY